MALHGFAEFGESGAGFTVTGWLFYGLYAELRQKQEETLSDNFFRVACCLQISSRQITWGTNHICKTNHVSLPIFE